MRTKRNLFTLAVGGIAGYLLGRYPEETFEKLRSGVGVTVGLCRERIGMLTERRFHLGHDGGHRAPTAPTAQPPEKGDDIADRTSTASNAHPHP